MPLRRFSMIDLTEKPVNTLTLAVLTDEYFMVERDNVPFLLALACEEYYYTADQLAHLTTAFEIEKDL
jgi:hypothetical protein